jgi:hypothetical protein
MVRLIVGIGLAAALLGGHARAETREFAAMKALHLREFRPHFSEFGDYLLADFKLQNTGTRPVKDIVLQCTTDGFATQDMSVIVIPVFLTVPAHATLAVIDFDFRYTPFFSDRVVCGIVGLSLAPAVVSYSK